MASRLRDTITSEVPYTVSEDYEEPEKPGANNKTSILFDLEPNSAAGDKNNEPNSAAFTKKNQSKI